MRWNVITFALINEFLLTLVQDVQSSLQAIELALQSRVDRGAPGSLEVELFLQDLSLAGSGGHFFGVRIRAKADQHFPLLHVLRCCGAFPVCVRVVGGKSRPTMNGEEVFTHQETSLRQESVRLDGVQAEHYDRHDPPADG